MKLLKDLKFHSWKHFKSEMKHRFRQWDLHELATSIGVVAALSGLVVLWIIMIYFYITTVMLE